MRAIATNAVAWSVCLCVCLLITLVCLQNGWTYRDAVWGVDSGGPVEPWRGNFGGCPAHSKTLAVSAAVFAEKGDHSILNNGTTCDAAFCQNSLTDCSLVKIRIFFLLVKAWIRNVTKRPCHTTTCIRICMPDRQFISVV